MLPLGHGSVTSSSPFKKLGRTDQPTDQYMPWGRVTLPIPSLNRLTPVRVGRAVHCARDRWTLRRMRSTVPSRPQPGQPSSQSRERNLVREINFLVKYLKYWRDCRINKCQNLNFHTANSDFETRFVILIWLIGLSKPLKNHLSHRHH